MESGSGFDKRTRAYRFWRKTVGGLLADLGVDRLESLPMARRVLVQRAAWLNLIVTSLEAEAIGRDPLRPEPKQVDRFLVYLNTLTRILAVLGVGQEGSLEGGL